MRGKFGVVRVCSPSGKCLANVLVLCGAGSAPLELGVLHDAFPTTNLKPMLCSLTCSAHQYSRTYQVEDLYRPETPEYRTQGSYTAKFAIVFPNTFSRSHPEPLRLLSPLSPRHSMAVWLCTIQIYLCNPPFRISSQGMTLFVWEFVSYTLLPERYVKYYTPATTSHYYHCIPKLLFFLGLVMLNLQLLLVHCRKYQEEEK